MTRTDLLHRVVGTANEAPMAQDEVFGSDDQRAVLRRGRGMAELLGHNPRYTYYGRTVGLATPKEGDIDQLAALAKVQGNSNYSTVPLDQTDAIETALEARGLVPMHYTKWEGTSSALSAARNAAKTIPLPDDITLMRLDATTPEALVASFAALALSCGVLPPTGEVLRGLIKPAVCMIALDPNKNVVSCAASSTFAHRDHPSLGGQAWWGMLATHPKRRGRRLALILGAHTLLEMETRHGVRNFFTGVERGNAPSEAVCTRMGLAPAGFATISCTDPLALESGRMTK